MLLDIDHVAFSSLFMERDIQILQTIGYRLDFIEANIENLTIKSDFLRNFSKHHDISLLTSNNGFNIELVNHRNCHNVHPYLIPVFKNLPPHLIADGKNNELDYNRIEARMKIFDIPIYLERNSSSPEFKFNELVMYVNNITKTKKFFEILGFKVINKKNDLTKLEFKSLFSNKSYFLFLKQDSDNSVRFLDDGGPNCIALLSSSIENEKNNLHDAAFYTTPIQSLVLNKKLLNIFFSRGPSNEIIEIISMEKYDSTYFK